MKWPLSRQSSDKSCDLLPLLLNRVQEIEECEQETDGCAVKQDISTPPDTQEARNPVGN
jgi:hypothetical protein